MARAEMPAEHAILGLLWLAEADGSGYGYDLARHFSDGQPLAEILRLEPGMLYHHLKKLDRAGWVTAEREEIGPRPPRRIYKLTGEGRTKLLAWLGEPVAHTREIRLEFLVKLYFARRLDPERAARLLAEQRTMLERIADSLAEQVARFDHQASSADPADRGFTHLVLELRLSQTRAAMAWLEAASQKLGAW
ncbi:MAG: PadR family transcriptional regulator [Chloroflexia bacterium]|nr:PadR family transcriptional regulator [Chloroflexia bacterium]